MDCFLRSSRDNPNPNRQHSSSSNQEKSPEARPNHHSFSPPSSTSTPTSRKSPEARRDHYSVIPSSTSTPTARKSLDVQDLFSEETQRSKNKLFFANPPPSRSEKSNVTRKFRRQAPYTVSKSKRAAANSLLAPSHPVLDSSLAINTLSTPQPGLVTSPLPSPKKGLKVSGSITIGDSEYSFILKKKKKKIGPTPMDWEPSPVPVPVPMLDEVMVDLVEELYVSPSSSGGVGGGADGVTASSADGVTASSTDAADGVWDIAAEMAAGNGLDAGIDGVTADAHVAGGVTSDEEFKCKICGAVLSTLRQFKMHEDVHFRELTDN